MVISGSGFSANAHISVSVLKPDHVTDEILNVFAGASGSFSTQYTPLAIPGRYKITATDGTSSATTAVTEADAVNIDIEQCRNDSASATPTANCISSNGGVG